jgi:hypothetical protein
LYSCSEKPLDDEVFEFFQDKAEFYCAAKVYNSNKNMYLKQIRKKRKKKKKK